MWCDTVIIQQGVKTVRVQNTINLHHIFDASTQNGTWFYFKKQQHLPCNTMS